MSEAEKRKATLDQLELILERLRADAIAVRLLRLVDLIDQALVEIREERAG